MVGSLNSVSIRKAGEPYYFVSETPLRKVRDGGAAVVGAPYFVCETPLRKVLDGHGRYPDNPKEMETYSLVMDKWVQSRCTGKSIVILILVLLVSWLGVTELDSTVGFGVLFLNDPR